MVLRALELGLRELVVFFLADFFGALSAAFFVAFFTVFAVFLADSVFLLFDARVTFRAALAAAFFAVAFTPLTVLFFFPVSVSRVAVCCLV